MLPTYIALGRVLITRSLSTIGCRWKFSNCFSSLNWSNFSIERRNPKLKQLETSVFVQSPVWPDLAKIRHFCKILKVFGNILRVYLIFGIILNLLWQILNAIGLVCIYVKVQIFQNNLVAIWSHWFRQSKISTSCSFFDFHILTPICRKFSCNYLINNNPNLSPAS